MKQRASRAMVDWHLRPTVPALSGALRHIISFLLTPPVLVPLLLAASARPAAAGGIQLVERGTRALGRGGAAVVSSDDPVNGSYLNPAALLHNRGWFASVEAALIDYAVEFTRYPDPDGGDPDCCKPARSRVDYVNPGAGVGYAAPSGRWAAALAAFGPYAGATEFDRQGDSRYLIVDQANALAYVQLSGALRLLPGLTLGFGLQLREFRMYQQVVGSVYPGMVGAPEDPQLDALIDVRVDDWFSPGFVAGLLWTPRRELELGFSYQNGFDVDGTGTLRAQIPSHYMYASMEQHGDRLRLTTRLPDIFRLGARLLQPGRFDLEFDVVWERWSQHDFITAIPDEPIYFTDVIMLGNYQMGVIRLEDACRDTFSVRLGGELELLPEGRVRVRAGAFWENGASPDETLNPGAFDSDKLGIGAGATLLAAGLEWDVGLLHLFFAPREVTTSRRRQVNPLYPAAAGPTVVGNGSYRGRMDVLAVSTMKRW